MSYTIKIKNDSGSTQNWAGKEFAIAEEYTVPTDSNRTKYQNNEALLTAIGNNDAVVGDGSDYFTDINQGINWLKGYTDNPADTDGVPLSRTRAFANADNMRFRGTGVAATCTKTATTNVDYKLTENRFINGLEFIVKNHVFGDSAKFQVVDVDNLLGYGAGLVLDEFGTDWYIADDTQRQGPYILPYPALVNSGFYLRIVYNSVGTSTDVSLQVNYFLHKKT